MNRRKWVGDLRSVGQGYTGQLNSNGPARVTGYSGKALSGDGFDDYECRTSGSLR